MRSKTILFASMALLLSSFVLTGPGFAGPKGQAQNTFLEAELNPTPPALPVEPESEGESDYRKQIHKGVTKQERFELKVKIPIPSTGLGILDAAAAQAADIRVSLSEVGAIAPYAVCFLKPMGLESEFDDGLTKTQAVYKVDVRQKLQKGGTYRQQDVHGSCDINVATPEVDAGVPAVEADDVATVALFNALITDFLQGTFE